MAIIKTIQNVNCKIYIDDEYAKVSKEEEKEILENICDIYYEALKTDNIKNED